MSRNTAFLSVSSAGELTFDVVVRDARRKPTPRDGLARDAARFAKLGAEPARAVEAAMAFLLDREPKESILGAFDIAVIRRYFPEFDEAFPVYLARPGGDDGKAALERLARRRRTLCMTVALARSEAALEDRWSRPRGLVLHDGDAGARAPADPAAPARRRGRPQHRRLYLRLSRLADGPLRHRTVARRPILKRHNIVFRPGPQRGSRRHRHLGRATSDELSRRDGRRRVRRLVRQGARRRPLGRRAAPRQLHRRLAQGRRDRARRRRPRREILDRGQFLRHVLHRRRHAGALSVEHPGADRLRPARHRDVALLRLLGRHEGRHRRRRGRRHGLCRPGLALDRHSRAAEQSAGRRRRAGDRHAADAGGAALQSQASRRRSPTPAPTVSTASSATPERPRRRRRGRQGVAGSSAGARQSGPRRQRRGARPAPVQGRHGLAARPGRRARFRARTRSHRRHRGEAAAARGSDPLDPLRRRRTRRASSANISTGRPSIRPTARRPFPISARRRPNSSRRCSPKRCASTIRTAP